MDILRKELNEIYLSQHLDEEILDSVQLREVIREAQTFARLTHGCAVITDAAVDRCFIHSGDFGAVMGYSSATQSYFETDSSDEDVIYSRIHPLDLVDKRLLEYEFFKHVDKASPEEKINTIARCRIRMRDRAGNFRLVDNTTQLVALSPRNKIWLILCTYIFSSGQNIANGINPHFVATATGDIVRLTLGEKRKSILTDREKRVLHLIKEGMSSKMIADNLRISIHTVNRHRQNIIEKLDVGNSIEAVTAAQLMNLL